MNSFQPYRPPRLGSLFKKRSLASKIRKDANSNVRFVSVADTWELLTSDQQLYVQNFRDVPPFVDSDQRELYWFNDHDRGDFSVDVTLRGAWFLGGRKYSLSEILFATDKHESGLMLLLPVM